MPELIPAPVSVVIRNLNEGCALRKVLRALKSQTRQPAETIVVDNESTDNSREVAREYGAKIVSLPRNTFTYGRALNVGIREATQPFVLLLSAHAVPLGRNFVDEVLDPFKDPSVGAVKCRNAGRKEDLADWPAPLRLSGNVNWETLFIHGLINSAAAIRRALWIRFPFDESLPYSEDALWSRQVLLAGHTIETSAAMYVYLLDRGLLASIRRRDQERIANYRITGLRPSYSASRLARALLVRGPKAALRVMVYECLLCASSLSVPLRVRKSVRPTNQSLIPSNSHRLAKSDDLGSLENSLRLSRQC